MDGLRSQIDKKISDSSISFPWNWISAKKFQIFFNQRGSVKVLKKDLV